MKLRDWWATRELVRAAALTDRAILGDLDDQVLDELLATLQPLRRRILTEKKRRQGR